MTWLAEYWSLILGGPLFVILLVVFTRKSTFKSIISEQKKLLTELKVDEITDILEKVVGDQYDFTDRRKIALTMMAIIISRNIEADRIFYHKKLFLGIMMDAVALLTIKGEIDFY